MQVTVSGRHTTVPEALHLHARQRPEVPPDLLPERRVADAA